MFQTLSPKITIIVLNRNGLTYLKTLLPALNQYTHPDQYELIMIDNASTDQSVSYLKQNKYDLPMVLIENDQNLSFSAANNQAAAIARGEYLLLLNNDVIPAQNWLDQLLKPFKEMKNIASVGAKLIYPDKKGFKNSGLVQHAGITFVYEGEVIRPYNLGNGYTIDHPVVNKSQPRPALTAACLLVHKEKYLEVGGLDENYQYGFEDVDLGLKLLQAGYINYYCAEITLIHCEFGTQSKDKRAEVVKRRQKNLQYFQRQWFHYLKKAYWSEKLKSNAPFFAEKPLILAVVDYKDKGIKYLDRDRLTSEFKSFGWKIVNKTKNQKRAVRLDQEIDIIVSFSPDVQLKMRKSRKKQVKVLLIDSVRLCEPKKNEQKTSEQKITRKLSQSAYDIIINTTVECESKQTPIFHNLFYYQCQPYSGKESSNKSLYIADSIKSKAIEIKKELYKTLAETSIAIIIPEKKWHHRFQWNGLEATLCLKQALLDLGYPVLLQVFPKYRQKHHKQYKECNAVINTINADKSILDQTDDYQIKLLWDYACCIKSENKQQTKKAAFLKRIFLKNTDSVEAKNDKVIQEEVTHQAKQFIQLIVEQIKNVKKGGDGKKL